MRLNKREKNLLIILSVILLFFGYYKLIISPQSKNLKTKQKDKAYYENELVKIQTIIDSKGKTDNRFLYVNDKIDMLSQKYFSEINQSQFILLINELLEGTGLFVKNIFFSPIRTESIGDALIEIMTVTLPYEGEYSSLLLFLERIREYKPKIIIQNMNVKIKENKLLSGTILLDFYSLPDLVRDTSTKYLFDSSEINPNPFYSLNDDSINDDNYHEKLDDSYNEKVDDYYDKIDLNNVEIKFDSPRIIVEGFDDKILDFVSSHPNIKCEMVTNKNSKQGTSSLGLYYNFPPIQDKKYIHVIFNSEKTVIYKMPQSIGLWVYSYDVTKHDISLRIRDKKGNKHNLNLYSGIDWIGWKHLKTNVPKNELIFPIEIEKIIIDINSPDHGKGVLLFDALEAFYTTEDIPIIDESNIGNYKLYDVQIGDTLSSISKTFYNDVSKQGIIKKYNGINNDNDLKPGKTIVIPNI